MGRIKLSKKCQALIFSLLGLTICIIIIFANETGAFTAETADIILIAVLVIYTIGFVFTLYGAYIISNIYGEWLNKDYGEEIYKKIMTKK